MTWLVLIIWSLAALLVHVLFPNLYLGLFVLIRAKADPARIRNAAMQARDYLEGLRR